MAQKQKSESGLDPVNRPFSELASLLRKAGIRLTEEAPLAQPPPERQAPRQEEPEPDDDQAFADAMKEVPRMNWRHEPAATSATPVSVARDAGLEDERLFQEAVDSAAAPPILDHPEYIEGWIGVAGKRFLPNLRSGTYSIQATLDLHGLSRVEAREALEQFILHMSRERSCCVRIVHGRGLNSPTDKAVLKDRLPRWLSTRRMSRHVVAYASAPYSDGGVGAIYVLLRRMPGR